MNISADTSPGNKTRITMDGVDFDVPQHWFWQEFANNWEPQTFEFFSRNLIAGTEYLDVGGWIGATALIATRLGAMRATVVEPNPINFTKLLYLQFQNARLLSQWTLLNVCVSGARGFTKIGPLEGILGASSATNIRDQNGVEVLSVLLEDIVNRSAKYSLIKIDIEGAEEFIADELTLFANMEAAVWLSLHPPFLKDKVGFVAKLKKLSEMFFLTDQHNQPYDVQTIETRILWPEPKPVWGTSFGNFFEIGLLPKRIFSASGHRI
jgi:FkbM family methyltransferase